MTSRRGWIVTSRRGWIVTSRRGCIVTEIWTIGRDEDEWARHANTARFKKKILSSHGSTNSCSRI